MCRATGIFEAMAQIVEDTGKCLAISENSTMVCRASTGSGSGRAVVWECEVLAAGWPRRCRRMWLHRHCRVVTCVRKKRTFVEDGDAGGQVDLEEISRRKCRHLSVGYTE